MVRSLLCITFYLLLFVSCTDKGGTKSETKLSLPVDKIDRVNDTLYKGKNTLIINSKYQTDTLLRFESKINDSLYLADTSNIKFEGRLDFSKYEYKKMFITVIKEGVQENGVNFAGHFCFVHWGCGAGCQVSAVVDMKTGIVYNGLSAQSDYRFEKNSKIMTINPTDSAGWYDKNNCEPLQYFWNGTKFTKLKSRS